MTRTQTVQSTESSNNSSLRKLCLSRLGAVCLIELRTKVHKDFTITEKLLRAVSWWKVPTSAFTFRTLLRHHVEQMLTHGMVSRHEIGTPTQMS